MGATLPILAGMVSTAVFAISVLPMLRKVALTRDLSSYSLGNIALANIGNAVHSFYHLPPTAGADLVPAHVLRVQLSTDALLVPALSPRPPRSPSQGDKGNPMTAVAQRPPR